LTILTRQETHFYTKSIFCYKPFRTHLSRL